MIALVPAAVSGVADVVEVVTSAEAAFVVELGSIAMGYGTALGC